MKVRSSNFEVRVRSATGRGRAKPDSSFAVHHSEFAPAFTLIEIMVVVAIIGVMIAASVPSLRNLLHKEGFRKTVNDITEVCVTARSRAIVQGVPTQVVFYPLERRCEVVGGSAVSGSGLAQSVRLDDGTTIEMLDVNLSEYRLDEIARVNFYPEGTCDEMTLILRSDRNEWRKISLEITTGLASVDSGPVSQWYR